MLTKWNPMNDFLGLTSPFNKGFVDLFEDFNNKSNWKPVVDIYEDNEKISIEAELPGIDPKDVDITIEKDLLTIKGKTESETKKERKNFFRTERLKGSFVRTFVLPSSVESDKILARYDKGVLTISIPKAPEIVPRKVDIKVLE